MVHDHLKGVRLDRRAMGRRDWISPADLKKELDALPDVSGKIDDSVAEAPEAPAEAPKG